MSNKKIYPWVVVGLLWGVALLNYMDRQMLSTMKDAMMIDITELESAANFGRLMAVFLWIYGFMSPVAGMIADRVNRKWLIVGSLFVWSFVTLMMGYCTTFNQIYFLRALMGVSEALYIPAGLSLITDYHQGKTRSLAVGIHMTGLYTGQALGGFGATVASAFTWETTFHWFGIVGIAYSVILILFLKDKKDLGIHSEMISDGVVELVEAGVITNKKKTLNRGKGVFSICSGSRELYEFLDQNMDILSAPMRYVNNPETIRQLDHFVSINGCIAMDLYGQVCSETSGTRHISGTGGQLDFVTGAYMAEHGQAFLAMPSTFTDKEGVKHSRILPKFTDGDVITTPRTQAPTMVTEYGTARLSGLSTWERAEKIIAIAHPDFREELIAAAQQQKIWRRSNK